MENKSLNQEGSLYQKLLEESENVEINDQIDQPIDDKYFRENSKSDLDIQQILKKDENGLENLDQDSMKDEIEYFKRDININEIRNTGFPRDSLELYLNLSEKHEKPRSVQNLKERELEINDLQKIVIYGLVKLGVSLEQAVIITDLSKAGSITEYFEYIENNPNLIDHGFSKQEDQRVNFQSFGLVQKYERCSICNKLKTDHKYVYTLSTEVDDVNNNTDPYSFLKINSSVFKEQGEVINSMQILLEEMENNNLVIRENKNEQVINLEISLEDLIKIQKLRIASHILYQTCQICYEDFELNNIISYQGELHDICISCFQTFLRENIKVGKVLDMKCPHCNIKLTYKFIQKMLDVNTFSKYRQFLLDQLVSIDPSMRWCPNVKCGQSVKLRPNYKRKEKCDKCDALLCTECNREYHKGSCKSVFQQEIKKWEDNSDIQRCKICKTVVAKISGCNHMTCKVCEYEWCWLCGGRYDKIHFFFLNPFGCASLQFHSIVGWKLVLYKILIFISCVIIFPFLLILTLPVYFINSVHNSYKYSSSCITKAIFYPLVFIGGLILQPLADVVFFVCIIPFLIFFFWKRRKEKQVQISQSKYKIIKNQIVKNLGIQPEELV